MLFNSYLFLLVFLPITWIGYRGLSREDVPRKVALTWLVACSLFFYGWWNPRYVLLLGASILVNYALGRLLARSSGRRMGSVALTLGVALNLAALGYFKYANFFVDHVLRLDLSLEPIVLPLAISFFTFQQIAFLVDAYRGETREPDFIDYTLFVTFFPQLIAGPIVHHKEMLPQFDRPQSTPQRSEDLAVGGTIFAFGLAKKVLLADLVAGYATPVFGATQNGVTPDLGAAWVGLFAYTLQIYFDFSGYSDMAIGLGRLFGIRLPVNFDSPYRADSIVDFWRRWHMTLSRFLRDYLYIPLGGNRHGRARRYVNVMITMLLGGLWHGAGWTFVVWGGLHGSYLCVEHAWRRWRGDRAPLPTWLARTLTLAAVMLAWVFFRAENFEAAQHYLAGLAGAGGLTPMADAEIGNGALWVAAILPIALFTPNTQQWLAHYGPAESAVEPWSRRWAWHPTPRWGVITATLLLISILRISSYSEFIYFQF
ncbi:MAG: MBOAT family protein [Planctomycetes bacterium]|nr:MBOAT family protein [Planctomycetota bacterium]